MQELTDVELSVGEFVALLNQTLEFAYPSVVVTGELANFRVSKNRWVYFDLKDETALMRCFGTVYQLPGPLEDGMVLKVRGQPRLHPLYGFNLNIASIQPAGEGTIRRAAELLQAKLAAEGLFEPGRKRPLPYPPASVGLITSRQSAAYADFTKILGDRWGGVTIELIDVQVQGEAAPAQITQALEQFNARPRPPEVLVIVRGGGSAEDLAAYSTEQVTRAVAASRVPTLVAIGHEVDVSLAELAADRRASTPSNAAEVLVPDREQGLRELRVATDQLQQYGRVRLSAARTGLLDSRQALDRRLDTLIAESRRQLQGRAQLLAALSPEAVLRRGYAVVRRQGKLVRSVRQLAPGAIVELQVSDGTVTAAITEGDKHP
jgi:exodeoxyribonuclease VII large subunit